MALASVNVEGGEAEEMALRRRSETAKIRRVIDARN